MHLMYKEFAIIDDLVNFVNKKAIGKTDIVKITNLNNTWLLIYWGI